MCGWTSRQKICHCFIRYKCTAVYFEGITKYIYFVRVMYILILFIHIFQYCFFDAYKGTHVKAPSEDPLRPQLSVDTDMCLMLELGAPLCTFLNFWPFLSQILLLHFTSSLSKSTPASHRRCQQEVNFKKLRKTKLFSEKVDFPKRHQNPRVFVLEM